MEKMTERQMGSYLVPCLVESWGPDLAPLKEFQTEKSMEKPTESCLALYSEKRMDPDSAALMEEMKDFDLAASKEGTMEPQTERD
jgi:hypothetical protein